MTSSRSSPDAAPPSLDAPALPEPQPDTSTETAIAKLQALEQAIAALQAQRTLLGDELVDAALLPLQRRLAQGGPATLASGPERRLRQVSVLFLDIVGSTHLIQHHEPEEVQLLIDGALTAFSGIVTQHGGEVLRYAGDSLKAAFGAQVSREDDTERAVLCGLELLREAARRGDAVRQRHGQEGLGARVGIHTGPVVRGGGVEGDKSLTGLAVNIAARMEQTAPAGALRISQATWALVRGVFDAEAQPPITVKGHDEPIATWLVKAAKPRAFRLPARGIAGVETPLIGREAELQRFESALSAVLSDRQPCSLTLLAEAGLGKSRLLREFQHRLSAHRSSWWLLPANAQPSGALQPYGLLRDLLLRRLEIADSDSADVARAKFVQGLAPWLDRANDPAPELLGQMIGLDFASAPPVLRLGTDARLLYARALTALRLWLERLAASDGSPVVLLLDDLHWADDASLDALGKLLKEIQGPVLALLGARPALLERRPDWGAGWPQQERVTLQPLDGAQGAALTQALLHRLGTVPPTLAEWIGAQAGGNPFYAEELVMLLMDRGVIDRGTNERSAEHHAGGADGGWTFHAERLVPGLLPTTLTAVLQARIDSLEPEARRALQLASVIGPVFWDEALARLDSRSPGELPELQKKAFVQVRSVSAIEHTVEEAFEHHLLHQVSYGTVLKPQRREAHARAAAWLTEHVGDRSDEYLAITAQHHERAGQHGLAADCYDRASIKALARPAYKAALQYADSAQEQLQLSGEAWPPERLLASIGVQTSACQDLALRDRQAVDLGRMLTIAEAHGQFGRVARALSNLSLLSYRLGKLDEADAHARRGAEVAKLVDVADSGALCWGNLAWMAAERREVDVAQSHLDVAMALAVTARERMLHRDDGQYVVQMLLIQCQIDAFGNQPSRKAATCRRALALVEGLNQPHTECFCHQMAADTAIENADWVAAARHIDGAEHLASEFGLVLGLATAQSYRGSLHLHTGQWEEAIRASGAAVEGMLAMGDVTEAQTPLACHAEALWRAGRKDEAVTAWRRNEAALAEQGDEIGARCARLRLAEAHAQSGHPEDIGAALQAVRAELPAMAEIGTLHRTFGRSARLAAWRVLQQSGDAAASAQLALAASELERDLQGFDDSEVRARVSREVPWNRDVLEALRQAQAGLEEPV